MEQRGLQGWTELIVAARSIFPMHYRGFASEDGVLQSILNMGHEMIQKWRVEHHALLTNDQRPIFHRGWPDRMDLSKYKDDELVFLHRLLSTSYL
jgi:hypothetical protein